MDVLLEGKLKSITTDLLRVQGEIEDAVLCFLRHSNDIQTWDVRAVVYPSIVKAVSATLYTFWLPMKRAHVREKHLSSPSCREEKRKVLCNIYSASSLRCNSSNIVEIETMSMVYEKTTFTVLEKPSKNRAVLRTGEKQEA